MNKIAIDLDGVVFDSENLYRVYTEIYDTDIIKKESLIDNTQRIFQKRYNWPEDTFQKFYQEYSKEILTKSNIMTGADIILPKLKKEFELIIVTSRSDEEIAYSKNDLEKIGLSDIKIFNNEHNKIDRFLKENVSFIIDDDEHTCITASQNNIKALYFKNNASTVLPENEYLKVVNNWGEIYKYLNFNK